MKTHVIENIKMLVDKDFCRHQIFKSIMKYHFNIIYFDIDGGNLTSLSRQNNRFGKLITKCIKLKQKKDWMICLGYLSTQYPFESMMSLLSIDELFCIQNILEKPFNNPHFQKYFKTFMCL